MAFPHIPEDIEPEQKRQPILTMVSLETHQLTPSAKIESRSFWIRSWHWMYLTFLKRGIDILVAALALLLVSPLLLVVALASTAAAAAEGLAGYGAGDGGYGFGGW